MAVDLTGAHHWRHGWHFRRGDNGDVDIYVVDGDKMLVQACIPAAEWASIVAAVTPEGDNGETYQRAVVLHEGKEDASDG